MTKKLKQSEIVGCIFTWIMGVVLHMLYNWTNQNQLVGLFSPVNESVWEHLKLIFFPILFYSIYQYIFVGKDVSNYVTAKLLGILSGISTVVVVFYFIYLIFGKPITWIDILLFFVSIAIAYTVSYQWMKKGIESEVLEILSTLAILLLSILFFGFTLYPPDFILFR